MKLIVTSLITIILALTASAATPVELTRSFPGAEGWGMYTSGGRGGRAIHVTNLNDNGAGSLRAAIEATGPRIIVFDVSGTIHLKSGLSIRNPHVTIAGQTAPGGGICIADHPVSISTFNVIIRYLRFRPGNESSTDLDGLDALTCQDSHHIMVDHCSMSWSTDECCSIYGNTFSTVQWCLISQSLRNAGHSKGSHGYGGMMGGEGATYHHNLLAHHDSRAPRLGEREATGPRDTTDFRCNVMYNWSGLGCYGCENMNVNIVNNYYKPGAATRQRAVGIQRRICGVGVNETVGHNMYHVWSTLWVDGNANHDYPEVAADNWNVGIWQQIDARYRANASMYGLDEGKMHLSQPMKYFSVTTHTAEDAYNRVLDWAGASIWRDQLDELMVSDTRLGKATYTGSGSGNGPGIIDSPRDNRPADAADNWSPWPEIKAGEAPLDTDRDGMPDEWETAHGLDPNDANDALTVGDEGYTMLEVYINSLVDDITEAQNAGGTVSGEVEYRPAIADTYELSMNTRQGTTGWTFEGGTALSGGSYASQGRYIGLSRNNCHTIKLPEFAYIHHITIEGHARYTTDSYGDAQLVELNGRDISALGASLPKGTADGTIDLDIEPNAMGTLTMTWQGNNPWCVITLHASDTPLGAEDAVISLPADAGADDRWFNLQGIEISRPTRPGIYIHGGKKTFIF